VFTAYLSLGSNIGNRGDYFAAAISLLGENRITVVGKSSVIETDPVDYLQQPKFLNQVLKITTDYSAENLLCVILDIEKKMGRIRTIEKGPRIIDIDILLYENLIISNNSLTIPHKELHNRKFFVDLLVEIDNDIVNPLTNKYFKDM